MAIGVIGEGICPAIAVCMGTAIGCEDIWADAAICAGIWVAICCPLLSTTSPYSNGMGGPMLSLKYMVTSLMLVVFMGMKMGLGKS